MNKMWLNVKPIDALPLVAFTDQRAVDPHLEGIVGGYVERPLVRHLLLRAVDREALAEVTGLRRCKRRGVPYVEPYPLDPFERLGAGPFTPSDGDQGEHQRQPSKG